MPFRASEPPEPQTVAAPNFKSIRIIPLFGTQEHERHATGFVVPDGGGYFLVTNIHVAAGRDPVTRQPIDPSGHVPSALRLCCWAEVPGGRAGRQQTRTWDVPLYDDDGSGWWFEHGSAGGDEIDVAAIRLPDQPPAVVEVLLGVYSGRLTDKLEAQGSTDLGVVWTRECIRQVVRGRRTAFRGP